METLWGQQLWGAPLWWGYTVPGPPAPTVLSVDIASVAPDWDDSKVVDAEFGDIASLMACWQDSESILPAWNDVASVKVCCENGKIIEVEWVDAEAVAAKWADATVQAGQWGDTATIDAYWQGSRVEAPEWVDSEAIDPYWNDILTVSLTRYGMTAFNNSLRPIVRGDTRKIERTFTGLPTGETIDKAWLTVKTTTSASDPGLFQVEITTTLSSGGQITDASSSDGQIGMYFIINGTQSGSATGGAEYVYDIQVKSAGTGAIHTLVMGTVTFVDGVTAATS